MTERILPPPSNQRLPGRLKFWETHGGETSPFHGIRDYVLERGMPDAKHTKRLAKRLRIPEATVRGVATYYADLRETGDVVVCQGTSCLLAGSDRLHEQLLERGETVKTAYCLGYCDRSPAILDTRGTSFVHIAEDAYGYACGRGGQRDLHAELPSIQCKAPQPIVTRRLLEGGAPDLKTAIKMGAYDGLEKALMREPVDLLDTMEQSGERGRGGAGFLTGKKWRACADSPADQRYVIANGDEGDPGSYIDRVLMEEDPHGILEGMLLCGYAVGATKGIVYIRSEYPRAVRHMEKAIDEARAEGIIGKDLYGTGFDFDVEVFPGLGSYVCGEETAMINAIEGLRGEVQIRPPYPTEHGLYGKPTVVNNVETLLNVPFIVNEGAETYANLGTHATCGTKVVSLNHGFANPGLVEVEFGITLREVIEKIGGGSKDRKPLAAVIVGGPMGSIVLPKDWDLPICYEVLGRHDIQFGHGGIVAVPADADFRALLEHWLQFMIDESCGKCAPCRLGPQSVANTLKSDKRERLDELFTAMEQGSLCAFGQFMPKPMRQLIQHFGEQIFE
ncbi:MAG: NADH:ubiquinone oxidoreductase subunit F (NADH-binding) [Verrucomicrobiales bacterium]|jgi:NADH:ubiquinone oxidoreductase subunit F (NADH-binding)